MQNPIEVMRVIRIPPMGKLVVQIGNQRLESIAEVKDDSVKGRLMAAVGELIVFAGGYERLVNMGVAPPLAADVSTTIATEEETLTAEQEAFLASLEEELKSTIKAAPTPTDTPEVALSEAQLGTSPSPAPEPGPGDMVTEINAILQAHVERDPALKARAIQLEQPLYGALQIRVDNNTYEHPNQIEEDGVRQVIKRALQEWESR